jgi:hypothetical protein
MFVRVVTGEKQTNLDDQCVWRENEGEGEKGGDGKGTAEASAKRDSHRGGKKTYSLVQYQRTSEAQDRYAASARKGRSEDADSEQPHLAPRRLRECCNV